MRLRVILALVSVCAQVAFAADTHEKEPRPLKEFSVFYAVFQHIKQQYVEKVGDKTLITGAIRGMLETLEPHSRYLDAASMTQLQASVKGEYNGLGVELTEQQGVIRVVHPIAGSPAARAGISGGDQIIQINNIVITPSNLEQSIKLMQGRIGASIALTLLPRKGDKPYTVKLTRAVIQLNSVASRLLDNGLGYIKIAQFREHTAKELLVALKGLEQRHHAELAGLILDLRGNPGGMFNAAVEVSDIFLDQGIIVSTRGRTPEANQRSYAHPGDQLHHAPLVVLINSQSASATEIVAGALQDLGRGLILGTRSFGKGLVQTVWALPDHGGLKLTTARYYTPSGRSIQGNGIIPDIEVEDGTFKARRHEDAFERDLPHALVTGTPAPVKPPRAKNEGDYPLSEAVRILRAMVFSITLRTTRHG